MGVEVHVFRFLTVVPFIRGPRPVYNTEAILLLPAIRSAIQHSLLLNISLATMTQEREDNANGCNTPNHHCIKRAFVTSV